MQGGIELAKGVTGLRNRRDGDREIERMQSVGSTALAPDSRKPSSHSLGERTAEERHSARHHPLRPERSKGQRVGGARLLRED